VVSLIRFAAAIKAAFPTSLVACVEAATIVLAVGTVRSWHSAFAGSGLALLALDSRLLGPALATRAPVQARDTNSA
jgi:uncharacterized membrane protein